VPKIGAIKLRKGRIVPPTATRTWLVRKCGTWYAQFVCTIEPQPLPPTGIRRGYDRGVRILLADSDGGNIDNPRILDAFRLKIERLQRQIAKSKKRGKNRRRRVLLLASLWQRITNIRRNFAHNTARTIVNACDFIALEDLRLLNMTASAKGDVINHGKNVKAKSGLNRSLLDAALGHIAQLVVEKAESAARTVVFVDPAHTSQTCSRCDRVDAQSRNGAVFRCVACGFCIDADHNAAINILKKRPS
jgi:putative transposase